MARREEHRDESYDLLNQYLQDIAKIKRLGPDEERELGHAIRQLGDEEALSELVQANLRFVVSYAKRFRNAHVLFLDLINEGNLGLIQAAKKFDPDKNVKFITYAVWWIRQSILHALSEQGGAFRLPPKRANLMYRLEKAIGAAITEDQRIPTPEELAEELGVSVKEVQTLLQASNENFSLSTELDSESHTELGELLEQTTVPSAEEEMAERSLRDELLSQLAKLTPKEQLVLTLRHGITNYRPKSLEEIGVLLGRPADEIAELVERGTAAVCRRLELEPRELAKILLWTSPHPQAEKEWAALPDATFEPGIREERLRALEEMLKHAAVQNAVDELQLEERTVLKLRFGTLQDEELTLRDIGELLRLSRERVRQIEARAEAKCRREVRRR
ncbi:MAG TPA: sigma-70 family RNA polymerase sigma factor [Thermoanaerobaculia bacterium]|nr:sigma-70 family RNA polymerase sigma factor [Thermoanaerobaculia bacterium]